MEGSCKSIDTCSQPLLFPLLCTSIGLILALVALVMVLKRQAPQTTATVPVTSSTPSKMNGISHEPQVFRRAGTVWTKRSSWNLHMTKKPPISTDGIEHVCEILKRFGLDPNTGFLPSPDPLQRLTHPKYQIWEQLADDIPKLLSASQARIPLGELPVISIDQLTDERELRRALLLLAIFAHSYVWNTDTPVDEIPEGVAVPLWQVAEKLQMPPVLTHASIVLYNWRRLDSEGPISIENMATLNNFFDGRDESWFYLITADVEAKGAPALVPLLLAILAIQRYRNGEMSGLPGADESESDRERLASYVADQLEVVDEALVAICVSLEKMREGCHPVIFYNRVRPFLAAWKWNPVLPKGVLYKGVSEKRQEFYGGSAAQSALTPALDIALGISHENTKSQEFLHAMRFYMAKPHREFVEYMETVANIRPFVMEFKEDSTSKIGERLVAIYDRCMETYDRFRTEHINLVAEYILAQQHHGRPTKGFAGSSGGKGTGGTDLMNFLKPIRDNVRHAGIHSHLPDDEDEEQDGQD